MATITITLCDKNDGGVSFKCHSEPPLSFRDGAEQTAAQRMVVDIINFLAMTSESAELVSRVKLNRKPY